MPGQSRQNAPWPTFEDQSCIFFVLIPPSWNCVSARKIQLEHRTGGYSSLLVFLSLPSFPFCFSHSLFMNKNSKQVQKATKCEREKVVVTNEALKFFFESMMQGPEQYGYCSKELDIGNQPVIFKGHLYSENDKRSIFIDILAVMKGVPVMDYLNRKDKKERLHFEYSVLTSLDQIKTEGLCYFPRLCGWILDGPYRGLIIPFWKFHHHSAWKQSSSSFSCFLLSSFFFFLFSFFFLLSSSYFLLLKYLENSWTRHWNAFTSIWIHSGWCFCQKYHYCWFQGHVNWFWDDCSDWKEKGK